MVSSLPLLLLLFQTSVAYALTNNEISSVLEFCKDNGKRYLNVVNLDEEDPNIRNANERLKFMANEINLIYVRNGLLIDNNVNIESMKFDQDSLLILASATNSKYWQSYLKMMTYTKIMSSIMVMIGDMNEQRINEMKSFLENIATNSLFYWAHRKIEATDELMWHQILTIDNYKKFVINPINFY